MSFGCSLQNLRSVFGKIHINDGYIKLASLWLHIKENL